MSKFKGHIQPATPTPKPSGIGAEPIKMARWISPSTAESDSRSGWVNYGVDNKRPDYTIKQYLKSPIHGTLCKGIAAMIAGKGITGVDVISEVDVLSIALDLKLHGGFYVKIFPSLGGDVIAKIEHMPFERVRLQKANLEGEYNGVWYSRDFSQTQKEGYKPVYYKRSPDKEFRLWSDEEKAQPTVAWGFLPTPGSLAYPKPDYEPGMNYVELSQQISEFHINNIMNGLFPSVVVSMIDSEADPQKRAKLKASLEDAVGGENAGRFLMLWTDASQNLPQITPFPINDADKLFEVLANQTLHQLLFAHRVTSPLLFGVRDTGGGFGSNKDEMVIAWKLFQRQVIEPFQRVILDVFKSIGYTSAAFVQNDNVLADAPAEPEPTKLAMASEQQDMTETDENLWLTYLESVGEKCDLDEWDLVEEKYCDSLDEPEGFRQKFSAEQKSKWGDAGLYKLRYRYSTNLGADSREFCKRMVGLANDGIMYRKEDIDIMSDGGVNGQFAPEGQTTYDIFKWKGGVYCHHKWVRFIFVRKRGADGKILPASKTSSLENDKRVANNPYVPKKGDEGVAPIDTPSRGSLKYG